jgi:hypothetical protein
VKRAIDFEGVKSPKEDECSESRTTIQELLMQIDSPRILIGELLITNQRLREGLAVAGANTPDGPSQARVDRRSDLRVEIPKSTTSAS